MNCGVAIKSVCDAFAFDFGYYPAVGAELECYITPSAASAMPERGHVSLIEPLAALLKSNDISVMELTEERGKHQIEIVFYEQYDIAKLAGDIIKTKKITEDFARERGFIASFAAKPFADQPGSGMHLHLSVHSEEGNNLFFKRDSIISDPLKFTIGGLLATMAEAMVLFAPNEDSYMRFNAISKESPSTISWGGNNRTTAIRLPESRDGLKHLEHRVPGADADPERAILAMLAGAYHGLRNRIEPPAQTFGDAFDAKYNLPKLPANLAAASSIYENGRIIIDYFG